MKNTFLLILCLVAVVPSKVQAETRNTTTKPEYVVSEWATDPAIANTVAISIDDQGRAYVTAARRRKQSSLDIRNHQDLVKKDLSLTTVEERRTWYREYLTGKNWIPDRNNDGKRDWRDLTVQKDSVVQVSDKDGDGTGEAIRILDEYHTEVTGIAAGVLAVGSDVFVAAEPDFLRYRDADRDGFPEAREVVATGFQVHMGQGGHNLSGVTLGPDGRVYWSLGDKGHYVETKEGKVYHQPNSGGIFRCELDGSRVERYSSGERNAQELAFDAHGNLFSMDNDGDYPGEKERALYITEGSEHGWRLNWQWLRKQDFTRISGIPAYNPWMDERLFLPDRDDHAAYLTPTIGNFGPGPCGFAANPGTALSPDLSDCFFMTNQQGQIRVFRFVEKGASFEFKEQAAIKGGRSNTGLAVGPDGALYSACYGGGRGSIFRFDVTEEHQHPAREETRNILSLSADKITPETLQDWLAHPDQRVRMKGQFELAHRSLPDAFLEVLRDPKAGRLAKLHSIWGIGQISRRNPAALSFLEPAWT
ncbi:MAG: heme-binding protein, partial [Verrucomicrobiaceae bacterium]|nr:heme-binding protein [Verrucomicrobiaceae bacterium]